MQGLGEYQDIVTAEARRAGARLGRRIELEELVAMATEGALIAIGRLDAERPQGVRRAYVRKCVRGHVQDALGDVLGWSRASWRRRDVGIWGLGGSRDGRDLDDILGPRIAWRSARARVPRRLDARRVAALLPALPKRTAEVLYRVYFEERSLSEAARLAGVSPSWASRLRDQGLTLLRALLAGEAIDGEPAAATNERKVATGG